MKKVILIFSMLLVSSFLFSGCGSSKMNDNYSRQGSTQNNQPVDRNYQPDERSMDSYSSQQQQKVREAAIQRSLEYSQERKAEAEEAMERANKMREDSFVDKFKY